MAKKGINWASQETGGLILLVIIAIVLALFYKDAGGETKDLAEKGKCLESIREAHLSKYIPGSKGVAWNPPNCDRKNVELKKDDVVENNVINQDRAHKIIADEMAGCWGKVGAGKYDPFSYWDDEDTTYCLVCGTITFSTELLSFINDNADKVKEQKDLDRYTVRSPHRYLVSHPYKEGSKVTYYEYIYPGTKRVFIDDKDKEALEKLDKGGVFLPGTTLMVQMYRPESTSRVKTVLGWIAVGVGVVLLVIAVLTTFGFGGVLVSAGIAGLAGLAKIAAISSAILGVSLIAFGVVPAVNNFVYCDECVGYWGGVAVIPPGMNLDDKIQITLEKEGGKVETKETYRCSQIVN